MPKLFELNNSRYPFEQQNESQWVVEHTLVDTYFIADNYNLTDPYNHQRLMVNTPILPLGLLSMRDIESKYPLQVYLSKVSVIFRLTTSYTNTEIKI